MFDFTGATFNSWAPGIPRGAYEFVGSRYQLGELSVTLALRGADYAFELIATPEWHCFFADESGHTDAVTRTGSTDGHDMYEIENSRLVNELKEREPAYEALGTSLRHWVILTMNECLHIVGCHEPEFREIYGATK